MELLLKQLHSYKNILWDWNGTLLNDVDVSFQIMQQQMLANGLKPLPVKELKSHFCFPIKKYYENLGFPTDEKTFQELAHNFMSSYKEKVDQQAKIFCGTKDMLSELQGKTQFIISASEESYLKEVVSSYQLMPFFEKLYGLTDNYGVSKLERCVKLMKENNLDPAETVLVGDTSHDAEVAQHSGISVQLVADGFHTYERLKTLEVEVLRTRYK